MGISGIRTGTFRGVIPSVNCLLDEEALAKPLCRRRLFIPCGLLRRVAAKDAPDDAAAVLFNAHYDAPLGSPGASDCAACVGTIHSIIALSRYTLILL